MRTWKASTAAAPWNGLEALPVLIGEIGGTGFGTTLLQALAPALPAASWSLYRVGASVSPALLASASHGVPDCTRQCWHAYLSGPYERDSSLRGQGGSTDAGSQLLHHARADDMPAEHQRLVYEPHGMAERLSIVEWGRQGDELLALNLYRHTHQPRLSDRHIRSFETLAPALLALARKHAALAAPRPAPAGDEVLAQRLLARAPGLTERELAVCLRLLRGMTHDG
ncbi:MAG: LuxR family transcriptional regulator, partial [Ottowia sp.]|nr:LuxR family transcriptional regulator [Ottowia sp.]